MEAIQLLGRLRMACALALAAALVLSSMALAVLYRSMVGSLIPYSSSTVWLSRAFAFSTRRCMAGSSKRFFSSLMICKPLIMRWICRFSLPVAAGSCASSSSSWVRAPV